MPRGQEQRLQLRFPVTEEEGVTGLLDGEGSREIVGIHDLSLTGAGLLVPDINSVRGSRLLQLGAPHAVLGETRIEPVHVGPLGDVGPQVVGVRFRDQSMDFLRPLCRYLVKRHSQSVDTPPFLLNPHSYTQSTDAHQIKRLLLHCCRRRRTLRLYSSAGIPVGTVVAELLRRDRVVGRFEGGGALTMGEPCYLMHTSFTAVFILPTCVVAQEGSRLAVSMPNALMKGGVRRTGRLPTDGDFPVYLEFLHPQLPGRMMRKLAKEVGLGGLRFEFNIDDDLLAPGTVIESAVLRLPSGASIACRCTVRHTFKEDGRYYCGVGFTDFPGHGRQMWTKELIFRMSPNVEEATPFNLHEAWDLFQRSGYLEEKPAERMETMRRPFLQTWSKLLGCREGARLWLYREQRRAVGTICTSRIYSTTWLVHHMAVDRELSASRKLIILADLFPRTAFQWLSGVEAQDNVMGYFDASRSFNQAVWLSFLGQQSVDAEQDVQQIQLSDIPLDRVVLPPPEERLQVRLATDEELQLVASDLLVRDGPFVCRAFDLSPNRMSLSSVPDGSLQRVRQVLVARDATHRMMGYALVESACPGVNIFALYDTCRIVVLGQSPVAGPTLIRDQLFAEAVRRHRHRPSLLYLSGKGDMPAPMVEGAFQAEAVRALISSSLIPMWVDFLNNIFVQR